MDLGGDSEGTRSWGNTPSRPPAVCQVPTIPVMFSLPYRALNSQSSDKNNSVQEPHLLSLMWIYAASTANQIR